MNCELSGLNYFRMVLEDPTFNLKLKKKSPENLKKVGVRFTAENQVHINIWSIFLLSFVNYY